MATSTTDADGHHQQQQNDNDDSDQAMTMVSHVDGAFSDRPEEQPGQDQQPQFPKLSAAQAAAGGSGNRRSSEYRRIRCPPHRYTPLREHWEQILTPLVEYLKLQVRVFLALGRRLYESDGPLFCFCCCWLLAACIIALFPATQRMTVITSH